MNIFISYSSKDRDTIILLADDLELMDHVVWFDRELANRGGHEWWKEILPEIEACDCFLYALSVHSRPDRSEPCKREHGYARALGKPILAIRLDNDPVQYLPKDLQLAQLLAFQERSRPQLKAIKESLKGLPSAPDLPQNYLELRPEVPLNPVGILHDRITNMSHEPRQQRDLILDIEEIADDDRYAAQVPELWQRLLKRDDVLSGKNLERIREILQKTDGDVPLLSTPVSRSEPSAPAVLRITPEQNRLLKIMLDPNRPPEERAEAGREINIVGDTREGVGLRADGLPDIAWCEVPAGVFTMGGEQNSDNPVRKVNLANYSIAKCPITYKQFGVFLSAPDGFENIGWWKELHSNGLAQQKEGPDNQTWKLNNHPRENVSWYQAFGFCKWLTSKLGYEVRLPLEEEWEKAARGTDAREYPWGNGYKVGYANIDESSISGTYLERTTAVGIYPQGGSPYKVLDLSGNVWEWQLNGYYKPDQRDWSSNAPRSLRGGSWLGNLDNARGAYRSNHNPHYRGGFRGFRVVCSVPSPSL